MNFVTNRRCLRVIAMIATASILAVAGGSPAHAAPEPSPRPEMRLVPAFDNDLPTSGLHSSAQATARPNRVATPLASWVCSIYASDPVKFANTIEGEGFQSCSGTGYTPQRVRVTLQRKLGLGFWNNLTIVDSGYVNVGFVQRDFIYDCSSLGTQTYRVVTDGYAVGGAYSSSVQSLNYLTVAC